MLERRVLIVNSLGLHARAAAKLVRLVNEHRSSVRLRLNDNEADAASILGIIALAAGKGSFVDLRVEGPDESETLEAVSELFINGFGER